MSGSCSYNTYESEDESSGWLMSSDICVDDDELSDELTLLNGDEDCDDDTSSFEALIKLSMRLKKEYNLREAAVQLERCDKIWDTMQLVKQMQIDNEVEAGEADAGDDEGDESEKKYSPSGGDPLRLPEGTNPTIPYIKYQPVQGNGNNALPNFYLAVKSQKKLYNCVTCGKQYSEERSLRLHSQKEHGVVMPKSTKKKSRRRADVKAASEENADHKTVNNSSNKDRDNAKSRLSTGSKYSGESDSIAFREGKKVPESRSNDSREKPYVCSICRTAFTFQRGITSHMMNVHDMTLEEARSVLRSENIIASNKPLTKKVISQKVEEMKKESVKKDSGESLPRPRYIYTCKPCGKVFQEKNALRSHASKIHNIVIPISRKPPLKIDGEIRYYAHYTAETIRSPGELSKGRIQGPKEEDKSYVRSIYKDERQRESKTMRSGRLISDGSNGNRPRRACATNTCYTESTKEEEDVLLVFSKIDEESGKALNEHQTTSCFLCKKAFVDIRKHLIDYHRINCPETILPLATNGGDNGKDNNDSVASSETNQSLSETVVDTPNKQLKQTDDEFKLRDEYVKLLRKNSGSMNSSKRYQCTLCCTKYTRRAHVHRHLDKYIINGVVQEHTSKKERNKMKVNEPLEDPLALTDFAESSRSESQEIAIDEEDDARVTDRKRNESEENERIGSSYQHLNKRRKIEESGELIKPLGSFDSTSDSLQYNNERDSVLVMAETISRLNDEEKNGNPRDTRDSSDRDSGIGISITIKKRNNSYEVVEKDSGDEEKSKDFEHSKDDNTCSDSSSDVTPAIFLNDNQEARRREILNSLDYSGEDNDVVVVESVRDDCVVIGDAIDKSNEGLVSCEPRDDDNEAKYCWNGEREHPKKDACTSLLGNVPSLKVMCAALLKKNELENLNSNHSISHQCPVCYRYYTTERDVTVHMLEHKVSRSDFRATRVHAIPSSALRRYGRRPV